MKKVKKILLLSILSSMVMTTYAAQPEKIKEDGQITNYPGLSYPQPQINRSSQDSGIAINDLLSEKITASGAAAAKESVSVMRRDAISEIAFALGSSGGLAQRMKEIKKEIDVRANEFTQLFDFSKMTVDNGVLAPVLEEGLSNYTQKSTEQIRIADKIYRIQAPAKFVSVYPTWQTYLVFSYPSYDMPSAAYLPKNESEKAIWDAAVKEGWKKGIAQANSIFEASFNRLQRDYEGMIKYKILLAQGLITPTLIARQNLGVTGGGKEMAINDQIFRISDHAALNPKQKDWKVEYPVTNTEELIQPITKDYSQK